MATKKIKAEGAAKEPAAKNIDAPVRDVIIDAPAQDDVIDNIPSDDLDPDNDIDVDTEILEMLSQYAESYPEAKGFYVTSDKQVFLEKNKHEAFTHQKSLEAGTEPEHYSIK